MRPATRSADAARILTFVRACRRRALLVLFVRYALTAALALLIPVAILIAIAHPVVAGRVPAVAAWLASACAVGMALAWTRTPNLRRIAAIADARLGLRDALVTSIQFIDAPDAMSGLLLRDAAARIAGQRPGDAFQFETTRSLRVVAGTAACALLVLGVVRGGRNARSTLADRPGSGAGAMGVSAPDRSGAARRAGGPQESPERTAAGRTVDQAKPKAAPPETGGLAANPKRPSTGLDASAASGGAPATPGAAAAGEGSDRAGAARGGLSGRGSLRRVPEPLPATPAYRAAWSRAQSAIARDRVPPEYRTYLKNYFTAIRPQGPNE